MQLHAGCWSMRWRQSPASEHHGPASRPSSVPSRCFVDCMETIWTPTSAYAHTRACPSQFRDLRRPALTSLGSTWPAEVYPGRAMVARSSYGPHGDQGPPGGLPTGKWCALVTFVCNPQANQEKVGLLFVNSESVRSRAPLLEYLTMGVDLPRMVGFPIRSSCCAFSRSFSLFLAFGWHWYVFSLLQSSPRCLVTHPFVELLFLTLAFFLLGCLYWACEARLCV